MKLTDRFDDYIIYKDKRLKIKLYFDIVLRSFELFNDKRLDDLQKLDIAIDMFVENKEDVIGLTAKEKAIIVNAIYTKFINEDIEEKESQEESTEKQIYDLDKDAEYIYASFLFDYNIDLFQEHGKLHWKKFKALLANLSEESKFVKVIGYRTMKIPHVNKHNREEVERLKKLKKLYSLEETTTVEDIDEKFENLASILRPRR